METLLRMTNRPLGTVTEGSLSALQNKYRQNNTRQSPRRPGLRIGIYRQDYTDSFLGDLNLAASNQPTFQVEGQLRIGVPGFAYAKCS